MSYYGKGIPGATMVLISSIAAAGRSTVVFTGLTSAYGYYEVHFYHITRGGINRSLQAKFSADNGSTFLGSGYLSADLINAYNTATLGNTNASANIVLSGTLSTESVPLNGIVYLYNFGSALVPSLIARTDYRSGANEQLGVAYSTNSTTGVNAIEFLMSSSTFAGGTFVLYGVKSS